MLTVTVSDLIAGVAVVSLASAAIGAVLEYCGHAIHHEHRHKR